MREQAKEGNNLALEICVLSQESGFYHDLHGWEIYPWQLVPSSHGKQMGRQWKQCQTLIWGAPKSLQMMTAAMKLKDTYSLEGKL